MRVLSICVQNNGNVHAGSYQQKKYLLSKTMPETKSVIDTVSFQGVRAGAGAALGTIAGVALGMLLTLGTGGLAAPLVLGCVGCATGGIACSGDEKSKTDDLGGQDYDDNGHSHYD